MSVLTRRHVLGLISGLTSGLYVHTPGVDTDAVARRGGGWWLWRRDLRQVSAPC